MYWDGGPKAIEHFISHHLKDCSENVICNALQLKTVEFEDSEETEPSPTVTKCFKSVSPRKYVTRSQMSNSGRKPTEKVNPLRIGV